MLGIVVPVAVAAVRVAAIRVAAVRVAAIAVATVRVTAVTVAAAGGRRRKSQLDEVARQGTQSGRDRRAARGAAGVDPRGKPPQIRFRKRSFGNLPLTH